MRVGRDFVGIERIDLGFEPVSNLLDQLRLVSKATVDHAGHDQARKRVDVFSVQCCH